MGEGTKLRLYNSYRNVNVLEAAKERMRFIFEEFPVVIASVSGGKDSTVIFHLALEVARELGKLPLRVLFVDQEAEWAHTLDVIRETMYHPDVIPMWYQMPIVLSNATSKTEIWLKCWDPEQRELWIHEPDPISIKENRYGTDRFKDVFGAILDTEFPTTPAAYLVGIRIEESPNRRMGLTTYATYKWVTWGSVLNKRLQHFSFSPIYDWSYTDVWKAIHSYGWRYNKIYDYMFAYGVPVKAMRVSNLHHETAVNALFYLQEIEPDTYARLTRRLRGVDAAGKFGAEDFFVRELPFMFSSWREYRDYLLEHLLDNDPDPVRAKGFKERFRKRFAQDDARWGDIAGDALTKVQIASILTNDWEFTKLNNFVLSPQVYLRAKMERGGRPAWEDEEDKESLKSKEASLGKPDA